MTQHIFTYDCTLRDGEQCEGISLSLDDKLRIVERLDAFGIDFIEGGFPASNPKDIEFFRRVKEMPLARRARRPTKIKGSPTSSSVALPWQLSWGKHGMPRSHARCRPRLRKTFA